MMTLVSKYKIGAAIKLAVCADLTASAVWGAGHIGIGGNIQ
jgi:hypothetical protein